MWIYFFLSLIFTTWLLLHLRMVRHKPLPLNLFDENNNRIRLATHRGAGKMGEVPENTLAAFEYSTALGFRCHELDVRISKDGTPLLFHGPYLQKNTEGNGRVETKNFQELATLNWGHYLSDGTRYPVTSLLTHLKSISNTCFTNIEIKRDARDFSRGLEEKVFEIATPFENRIFFSSFNYLSLYRIRKLIKISGKKIPLGVLVDTIPLFRMVLYLKRLLFLPDSLHPPATKVTRKFVTRYKKAGYNIVVWYTNDPEKIRALLDWGVDLVIVDDMTLINRF